MRGGIRTSIGAIRKYPRIASIIASVYTYITIIIRFSFTDEVGIHAIGICLCDRYPRAAVITIDIIRKIPAIAHEVPGIASIDGFIELGNLECRIILDEKQGIGV